MNQTKRRINRARPRSDQSVRVSDQAAPAPAHRGPLVDRIRWRLDRSILHFGRRASPTLVPRPRSPLISRVITDLASPTIARRPSLRDFYRASAMPTWNSDQYLKFAHERTQPAVDLATRIVAEPRRVVDLGCGPGNSTVVLARRWPDAALTGIDNSPAMLAAARKDHPQIAWLESDIASWSAPAPFDVIFSNAALQWVGDHRRVFPNLLESVAPGGALAVQMPANLDAPPHRIIREVAALPAWRPHFPTTPREWHTHPPEFYYDLLAPRAKRLELWLTDYVHILENLDGIVEWYRGTGLRPWLEALPDEATRNAFLGAYRARLVPYYFPRDDGRVLFPFRRLFIIAYR